MTSCTIIKGGNPIIGILENEMTVVMKSAVKKRGISRLVMLMRNDSTEM